MPNNRKNCIYLPLAKSLKNPIRTATASGNWNNFFSWSKVNDFIIEKYYIKKKKNSLIGCFNLLHSLFYTGLNLLLTFGI